MHAATKRFNSAATAARRSAAARATPHAAGRVVARRLANARMLVEISLTPLAAFGGDARNVVGAALGRFGGIARHVGRPCTTSAIAEAMWSTPPLAWLRLPAPVLAACVCRMHGLGDPSRRQVDPPNDLRNPLDNAPASRVPALNVLDAASDVARRLAAGAPVP